MKTKLFLLPILALSGCASYPTQFKDLKVPAINAEGWSLEHVDGYGSVNLSVDKITSDATGVTAVGYSKDVSYPQWHDKVRIKTITFPADQIATPTPTKP